MAAVASDRRPAGAGSTVLRLLVALGLALGFVGLVGFVQAPSSRAAGCTGSTGVSVVVQFPGGGIATGCAPGSYSSALQAIGATCSTQCCCCHCLSASSA